MMRAEDLRDVSGLGGLPLFAVSACFAAALGDVRFVARLAGALALGYALTALLKTIHFRPRPEPQTFATAVERFDANSFPSIHAMRGTVFWMLVAERFALAVLVALAGLVIASIGATRVFLRRHHVGDVLVGVLTGAFAALVVFTFERRLAP
jgi:membrane-associated phospholipid phosphatase